MKPFLDNFAEIQEQFTAWWKRENKRPLIYAPAHWPALNEETRRFFPDPEMKYLDADAIFRFERMKAEKTGWCGVDFPYYCPGGPTGAYYGATPVFNQQTIWHRPTLENPEGYTKLCFHENGIWWQKMVGMMEKLAALADGYFFVAIPNLYSPLDILESVRGGTNLCLDLVDCPELVRNAQEMILTAWRRQFDLFHSIIQRHFAGSASSFLPAWSPGKSYTIQCDFSAMISPEMFEHFVAPEISAQARHLDHSLYHLDGRDAARHLDIILKIPELTGIQWQKGINGGATLDWIPLLKRIQKGGKLVFIDTEPQNVEQLCRQLAPEGLLVATACATEAESRELIRKVNGMF